MDTQLIRGTPAIDLLTCILIGDAEKWKGRGNQFQEDFL